MVTLKAVDCAAHGYTNTLKSRYVSSARAPRGTVTIPRVVASKSVMQIEGGGSLDLSDDSVVNMTIPFSK